jgi:nucleoid-associated protein YgaU
LTLAKTASKKTGRKTASRPKQKKPAPRPTGRSGGSAIGIMVLMIAVFLGLSAVVAWYDGWRAEQSAKQIPAALKTAKPAPAGPARPSGPAAKPPKPGAAPAAKPSPAKPQRPQPAARSKPQLPQTAARSKPQPAPAARPARPAKPAKPAKTVKPGGIAPAKPIVPSFDIVRVEPDGTAVIAGRAAPGANVTIMSGKLAVAKARANERGEWALVLTKPLKPGAHDLFIQAQRPGGSPVMRSQQKVAIALPPRRDQQPLVVLKPKDRPSRVLQEPKLPPAAKVKPLPPGTLALKTVDYDDKGRIMFSGRGAAGRIARIYVDNRFLLDAPIGSDGTWRVNATGAIKPGNHRLRVDELNKTGKVTARVELPFTRAEPRQVLALNKARAAAKAARQAPQPVARRTPQGTAPVTKAQPGTGTPAPAPATPAVQPKPAPPAPQVTAKPAPRPPAPPVAAKPAPTAPPVAAKPAPAAPQVAVKLSPATPAAQPSGQVKTRGRAAPAPQTAAPKVVAKPQPATPAPATPQVAKPQAVTPPVAAKPQPAPPAAARPQPATPTPQAKPAPQTPGVVKPQPATPPAAAPQVAARPLPAAKPAPAPVPADGSVVIQPGNNLWNISRVIYGRGIQYTVIYRANAGQIRNPNLIYPGQIFSTPGVNPPREISPHRRKPLDSKPG